MNKTLTVSRMRVLRLRRQDASENTRAYFEADSRQSEYGGLSGEIDELVKSREDDVLVFVARPGTHADGTPIVRTVTGPGIVFLRPRESELELLHSRADLIALRLPVSFLTEAAAIEGQSYLPDLLSTGGERRASQLCRLISLMLSDIDLGMPADNAMVHAYGRSIANFLLASHHGFGIHQRQKQLGGLSVHIVRRIHLFVADNIGEPISVEQLAEIAGLSRFHFSRCFKQATGLTPHQFVLNERIEAAIRAMKNERTSLTEIALNCGFGSSQSFGRAFRRFTGLSAREYRTAMMSSQGGAEIEGRRRA